MNLGKSVSLSICGLAPDTLYAQKQRKGRHFNQTGEAISRGNGYSKIDSFVTVLGSPPMP